MDASNPIHQALSALFIGPHAENIHILEESIATILAELENARKRYAPSDQRSITPTMQNSPEFQYTATRISDTIRSATRMLAKHSIPIWSPRYGAHMCSDPTMPALLGYLMGMLYNSNSICPEVSPFTTAVEAEVGSQFCRLFGYPVSQNTDGMVPGWGHVTCDGTVANIEFMWVARNLKYYPLSLKLAVKEGELQYIADQFEVQTCLGTSKLFKCLNTWELLNLRPETILALPGALNRKFGISQRYLDTIIDKYSVQTLGTQEVNDMFGVRLPMMFLMGKTKHYSWDKGAGLLGIGAESVVGVDVDVQGRVDLNALDKYLQRRLESKRAVFAVVALIGSTEVGAVDPLSQILAMRRRYQAQGLSFLVHADAAWGGYFTTMLPRDGNGFPITSAQAGQLKETMPLPLHAMSLSDETEDALAQLRHTDSITVDPHKAGYAPYPAGGVVYRDKRMGNLVSWTPQYLTHESDGNLGMVGLQGSKPGAAAMSVWLSNNCIGLNTSGYGTLLSEVSFNSAKMAAYWATLTTSRDCFVCVPFNQLPINKDHVRRRILNRSYAEILAYDATMPDSRKIMPFLRHLGSDLNINAFALNWRHTDGTLNTDPEEANDLMRRVVKRLSIDSPNADPTKVPFYLTSTEFPVDRYGKALERFKDRLGLKQSGCSLVVLRNTVMNPFMSRGDCFEAMMREFRRIVEEEVQVARARNTLTAELLEFHVHGTGENVYLVSLPRFCGANHRQQVIFAATLPSSIGSKNEPSGRNNPHPRLWSIIGIPSNSLAGVINTLDTYGGVVQRFKYIKDATGEAFCAYPKLNISGLIANHSLSRAHQDAVYPDEMPFFLYGSRETEWHISHIMVRQPNIVLNASDIRLDLDNPLHYKLIETNHTSILTFPGFHEAPQHPFPATNAELGQDFFFSPGADFRVNIWKDPGQWDGHGVQRPLMERVREGAMIATGWVMLQGAVFVDVEGVNKGVDGVKTCNDGELKNWLDEFRLMGKN